MNRGESTRETSAIPVKPVAFALKVPLQSFGPGLKAMGLASLGRKCNRHHAGFKGKKDS